MTAALSWPLQRALHATLAADAALATLLGGSKIYDAPPHADGSERIAPPFVLIGAETIRPWFDQGGEGAVHDVSVVAIGADAGFAAPKEIAGRISDLLLATPLSLERGRVVRAQFLAAEARKGGSAGRRRVELRLRFVLEDA